MVKKIIWFKKNYPELVKSMNDCFHATSDEESNPYHVENSVWTHTMMVCKFAEHESNEIQMAALLHDLGKVHARVIHENRARFFGHEGISVFKSISIIDKYNSEHEEKLDKIKVLNLISLHGALFDVIKDLDKLVNKFETFQDYSDSLTLLFCDASGRFSDSPRESLQYLKDINNSGTFLAYKNEKGNMPHPTLTVLVGLPGAGKSTYSSQRNTKVISRDYFIRSIDNNKTYSENWKSLSQEEQKEIDTKLEKAFREAVKTKEDICIDMTNLSAKSRRKFLSISGYHKEAVVFYTDLNICKQRRSGEDKFISDEVFQSMCARFTVPTYDEVSKISYVF